MHLWYMSLDLLSYLMQQDKPNATLLQKPLPRINEKILMLRHNAYISIAPIGEKIETACFTSIFPS